MRPAVQHEEVEQEQHDDPADERGPRQAGSVPSPRPDPGSLRVALYRSRRERADRRQGPAPLRRGRRRRHAHQRPRARRRVRPRADDPPRADGDRAGAGQVRDRGRAGAERPRHDGWVTLRGAEPRAVAVGRPRPARGWSSSARSATSRPRRSRRRARRSSCRCCSSWRSRRRTPTGRARATAETSQTAPAAPESLLDAGDTALLAGDYTAAVRFTRRARPRRVPALRQRIAASLVTQARTAQRERAYVRAIRLARRAARFGRAPGGERDRPAVPRRAGPPPRGAARASATRQRATPTTTDAG